MVISFVQWLRPNLEKSLTPLFVSHLILRHILWWFFQNIPLIQTFLEVSTMTALNPWCHLILSCPHCASPTFRFYSVLFLVEQRSGPFKCQVRSPLCCKLSWLPIPLPSRARNPDCPPLPPRGLRDTAMLPLRSSPPHYPHWLANSSACSGRACCSHPPAPPRMSSGSHPLLDSRISAQTGCPWPPCLSPSALHTGLCFFLTLVFSLTGSVSVALPRMWAAWEQGGGLFSLFPAVSLDPRAVQREGTKEVSGGWISGWCTDWMNCEN